MDNEAIHAIDAFRNSEKGQAIAKKLEEIKTRIKGGILFSHFGRKELTEYIAARFNAECTTFSDAQKTIAQCLAGLHLLTPEGEMDVPGFVELIGSYMKPTGWYPPSTHPQMAFIIRGILQDDFRDPERDYQHFTISNPLFIALDVLALETEERRGRALHDIPASPDKHVQTDATQTPAVSLPPAAPRAKSAEAMEAPHASRTPPEADGPYGFTAWTSDPPNQNPPQAPLAAAGSDTSAPPPAEKTREERIIAYLAQHDEESAESRTFHSKTNIRNALGGTWQERRETEALLEKMAGEGTLLRKGGSSRSAFALSEAAWHAHTNRSPSADSFTEIRFPPPCGMDRVFKPD